MCVSLCLRASASLRFNRLNAKRTRSAAESAFGLDQIRSFTNSPPLRFHKLALLFGQMGRVQKRHLLFVIFATACHIAVAGPREFRTNGVPASAAVTNASVQRLGEGIFQIGAVRLDKKQQSISFPASVNMHEGVIEYVLVNSSGKLHESLFKTDAEPYHIHTAMLLLGANGGVVKTVTPEKKQSEVAGDSLLVFASWQQNGLEKKLPIEDLVSNLATKTNASRGVWLYNGSRLIDGTFLAQRDGSIVSTIADPDALVNNPRPGRDNDDNWQVNPTNAPPLNTPVRITFQLQKREHN